VELAQDCTKVRSADARDISGEPVELEVYAIADATGPFRLPSIESLKQF
jgi:hypothetical protein